MLLYIRHGTKAEFYEKKSIKAYTQYIMNVANNPEEFYWMREDRKAARVTLVAERLGIRKQTFEERMGI